MSTERPDKAYVRRPLLWFFAAAVLLLCLVVGALWYHRRPADRAVEAALERIRAAGEPVTWDELAEMYEAIPHDPETTTMWQNGFQALQAFPFTQNQLDLPFVGVADPAPLDGSAWPLLAAAHEHLEKRKEALALLHRAARSEGPVRYGLNLRHLSMADIERVANTREAARLLALEADVRAYNGEVQESARSILAILLLNRTLEREPISISLMIRMAFEAIVGKQIARLLPAVRFSDDDLRDFQVALRSASYKPHLRLAILGERVECIAAFQEWVEHPTRLPPPRLPPGTVKSKKLIDPSRAKQLVHWKLHAEDDFLLYLEWIDRLIGSLDRAWPILLREATLIKQETQSEEARQLQAAPGWIGESTDLCIYTAQAVGGRRVADAAIAVELYRRRHGELPQRLDQLVPDFLPEMPEDPFTGEPLRYAIEENGYVVYSVGKDGVDDGGKGENGRGPDIVFRVKKPDED